MADLVGNQHSTLPGGSFETNLRERRDIGNGVLWVTDALDIDRLRVLIDRCREVGSIQALHELDSDVKLL